MMPETAKRTARVPILGEDGRISDDYVPAAIGEGVESAEAAATRAETAATSAEGSATAAGQSAANAQGSASAAGTSATQAQQSAATAGGAATQAQSAQQAAEAAKTAAETAQSAAAGSAQDAQQSATAAAQSAASVADKYISSARATTLEPGSQATASVADQVLTIGVPKGEKGDKGDTGKQGEQGEQGEKGDPGTAATIAVGSVTGLAAGASPTVVNSGTSNAAVLDFGIPKGDKGDKGDPGTGVPDGGTPGQLLSKTDSGTAWVDPPSTGNVLVGEAEGYVSHAEDAFPQKPREVRVKGKTWVNRWPVINGTSNGITVSTDKTGLVTITGTATADADVTADVNGWVTGKSYTTMISATPTGCSAYFEVQKPSGNTSINATTAGATLNVASDATNCVAGVHVTSGATVNASFRVMLVDGTEAPDCFTPPASITSAQPENLVTAGKNLYKPFTSGKVTANDDGSMTVVASTETWVQSTLNPINLPAGTQVTLSIDNIYGAKQGFGAFFYASDNSYTEANLYNLLSRTIQLSEGCVAYRCWFNGFTDSKVTSRVMMEIGSTATSFEPYQDSTTPLPEVELRSLPNGTCDELVIKADGSCEVERKTGYIASYTDEEVTGEYVSTGSGLEAGASIVYELDEPSTEPQSPVTLPALPAPTFNQYHDAYVPSDTTVTYARDLNIVIDNLAKQIAGTAATVAINEATR